MGALLRRLLWAVAGTLFCGGSALALYLFLFQEQMIYHPRPYAAVQEERMRAREISYETSQGRQVSFYLPPENGALPREVWVLFAGNASLALDWEPLLGRLGAANHAFLMVEYPGYGRCEGVASPESILESSQAAAAALAKELGVERLKFNAMGHSLGAAAALQFSSGAEVGTVILVAPFTSMRAMAQRIVGFPFSLLLKHNFDNQLQMELLARRAQPPRVLIFHGVEDTLIPVEMGRQLAHAHPRFASFHAVEQAGHDSILGYALKAIAAVITAAN